MSPDDLIASRAAATGCGPTSVDPGRPLRRQIFDSVRAAGAIARIDVAKELGVSPGRVTTLSAELIEAGLIREIESPPRDGDAGRGRPPVALGVRPEAGFVAGLKLSDHAHSAVVMDFAGGVVADARLPRDRLRRGAGTVLDEAETVLDLALAEAGLSRGALRAVGVGLPGLADFEGGRVVWSPILVERNAPFAADLARRIGCPVRIDNDANLRAQAELWFGLGRSVKDFAVVTIERGVGMGLVLDSRLWRGAGGLGGELGHTKVQLDGALCRCGQRGCLEAYVADYALVREASTALDWDHRAPAADRSLLEGLYHEAEAGNEAAQSIFRRAGRYLALALANIANLLDPPLIILSGERTRYDPLHVQAALEEMRHLTLDFGRPPPRVEVRDGSPFDWARGAAALALAEATDAALSPEEA